MTKAEKNYRRDYGHKDEEELVLNYSRDSLKEELDNVLETVNFDDLTADEKAYLNGRNQRKNHTLNIRFNDTEWKQICRQAELLKMKKSSYVQECAKAIHFLMISQDDMDAKERLNTLLKKINDRKRKFNGFFTLTIFIFS